MKYKLVWKIQLSLKPAPQLYLGLEIRIILLDLAKVLHKALGSFVVVVCYLLGSCYIALQTVIFMLLFLGKCRKIAFYCRHPLLKNESREPTSFQLKGRNSIRQE